MYEGENSVKSLIKNWENFPHLLENWEGIWCKVLYVYEKGLLDIRGYARKFFHIWGDRYTVKKGCRFSRPQPGCHLRKWHPGWYKTGNLFLQCSHYFASSKFPFFLTVYLFVCARPRDNSTYLNTHTHIQGRMPRKAVYSAQLLSGSRPLLRYACVSAHTEIILPLYDFKALYRNSSILLQR